MTLPTPASIPSLHRDVRFRIIDGEALVLRQEKAEVVGLNEIGSRVLTLVDSQTPVSEIVAALASEYDVEHGEVERDVLEFLGELAREGILALTTEGEAPR